jgi:MoaA/NifB/PqqE/SkfB family radical SAM enzyme
MSKMDHRETGRLLRDAIASLFKDAFKICAKNPKLAFTILKLLRSQSLASRRRRKNLDEGIIVPPVMIVSVTHQCNLKCAGCYSRNLHGVVGTDMPLSTFERVLDEAEALGVSFVMLAGGEPFMRPEIIDAAARHPGMVFPVFTNGTMLNSANVELLSRNPHIAPALSIEGFEKQTDLRRGPHVYEAVLSNVERFQNSNIFWGVSITVNKSNISETTQESFVSHLLEKGCRFFIFNEYIAVEQSSENSALNPDQRQRLLEAVNGFAKRLPGVFIAFPGDEQMFGGCLASGRGFVHINARGDLEPCPFAPYSDTSIHNIPLRQALASRFLSALRDNHDLLEESDGGCSLWKNREKVQALLAKETEKTPFHAA